LIEDVSYLIKLKLIAPNGGLKNRCNVSPIKKSPEDNQLSPGEGGLGQDDLQFIRTRRKARKTQREQTLNRLVLNSRNSYNSFYWTIFRCWYLL